MIVVAHEFVVDTAGRGFVDVGAAVDACVVDVDVGVATVFVHHTSASLLIQENADPAVRADLEAFFARLVQDGDPLFTHTEEGPDDMSAHVRSALTATSLSIPVRRGRLDLGRWQALYLFEHRTRPHQRRISVTTIGTARGPR
jgi:secondary thiamine-phosphate synthase enzyme